MVTIHDIAQTLIIYIKTSNKNQDSLLNYAIRINIKYPYHN